MRTIFLLLVSGVLACAQPVRHSELVKSEVIHLLPFLSHEVFAPDPRSDEIVYIQPLKGVIEAGFVRVFPGESYSPDRNIAISLSRFDARGNYLEQSEAIALVEYYRVTIIE